MLENVVREHDTTSRKPEPVASLAADRRTFAEHTEVHIPRFAFHCMNSKRIAWASHESSGNTRESKEGLTFHTANSVAAPSS